ncbi:hypothetical protein [Stutzerimonas nitrititolerans]|uniref:hypothetical protein n=1 Tax=Stutzerimonas nitrititolerans TaxID=2482751 RepID=UPI0028991D67|nr:hypothetical protein [Stutzerimonas nitrititolerans]
MSKVLVDRELLVRLENAYMEGMSIYGECEEIRAVLAQPAEAEGVIQCPASHPAECYALGTHVVHASLVHSIVRQADEMNAALSAVTAERDRLRSKWARVESERDRLLSDNASLRGSCKALGEENKQLKRENKRQGRTIAAMAAKEA